MNALRTGDPRIDMVVAVGLPFILTALLKSSIHLLALVRSLSLWHFGMHERVIEHISNRSYGSLFAEDDDNQNTILIKAVRFYLDKVINLKLRDADIDLTTTEAKIAFANQYEWSESDSTQEDDDSRTMVGALSRYRIVNKPQRGYWYSIGYHGKENQCEVKMLFEKEEQDSGETKEKNTRIIQRVTFRSKSGYAVDDFVDKAYTWYLDELRKAERNGRYLYELKSSSLEGVKSADDGERSSGCTYLRYQLSDEKTFDSLFFREKKYTENSRPFPPAIRKICCARLSSQVGTSLAWAPRIRSVKLCFAALLFSWQ